MAGVQCCDVSHDENMIVSCDVSTFIKVRNNFIFDYAIITLYVCWRMIAWTVQDYICNVIMIIIFS